MLSQLAIIGFVIVACFILRKLSIINTQLTQIMATQAELAAELAAKTAQVRKAIDEITTRLATGDRAALAHAVAVSLPAVLLTGGLMMAATRRWVEAGTPCPQK